MTLLIGFVLSIVLISIPSAIAMFVLWRLDRYEKEPLWLVGILFVWGALPAVILSFISQVILAEPLNILFGKTLAHSLTGIFVAPLTEETIKGAIILVLFLVYRREFDGVMDGILYGAMVGFGFSFVEDVLYLLGALDEKGWMGWGTLYVLRVGLFLLNHSLFTACIGAGFGLARVSKELWKKFAFPIAGWLLAMTLHGIHNTGAALGAETYGLLCIGATLVDWIGILMMFGLIVIALREEKKWFKYLEPELQAGVITAEESEWARNLNARSTRGWRLLSRHGISGWLRWSRYVQMIVDLAYQNHLKQVDGESAATDRHIAALRQRITQAREKLPVV
ncbi:MAG: PrsW family intramembrane metalloprotease [Chloroflexi bacterium]|nr:PrsW family intramembrane metalloprotease [Chloroflexota bacterium]